ncbi:MAG: uroporphyrinogen decarboxylase family protein [Verrucomicrobiae bacterium]
MTSRQLILNAIAHREPTQVPADLGATPSSGISAIAYSQLKRHLGMAGGHTRVYDVVQQLAQPEDAILDRYHIDVVDVGRTFNVSDSDWYGVTLFDGSPAQYPKWFRPEAMGDGGWRMISPGGIEIATQLKGMNFYDQTCYPWIDDYPSDMGAELPGAMGNVLWAALAHSPWDHAGDEGFWEALRANALQLRATTDRAITVVVGCNLFEWGTFLRRMDNFLMDLLAEPEQVEGLLDALLEIHLETLGKVCAAVGDIVDVCRFGDDLGTDTGPFMAPATYRELFKPRHAQLCEFVHRNSTMHTFLHSCGSIHSLLPDLIDAGFEIINPVQTACRDMEAERLKKDFGSEVTFWGGGCDTREVLNHGTPQQVKDDVRRRIDTLAPGGGFVFNTIHNILPDVPPANIEAMFEAVRG